MHSSAHDKAQRCSVLCRCSKCVQRALRGVVKRLRARRTLVVTAALVLLLLALCCKKQTYAHDEADKVVDDAVVRNAAHVAASPSDRWLLRPDAQHDGDDVRVMLLMVSTRVDAPLCYALASAYFADLPVVVLGYGGQYKSHIWRWQVYLDAIERAGLRDCDVVLLLDSDILFSGEDMLPFIDDYIARSPAAPSALDVRAVRAGTARAPSMYAAESNCATLHLARSTAGCERIFRKADDIVASYTAQHNLTYDLHDASVQPLRYLNGGVSIHRVWSLRELTRALQHYVATHKPSVAAAGWWCDQSVFALFYNDLRAWEVKDDVLRNNSTTTATAQRGPHGLRAGQLQLEHTGRVASLVHMTVEGYNYFSDRDWLHSEGSVSRIEKQNAFGPQMFAEDVWRRYGRGARRQRRTLTRAGNVTHTVDLTPPLLFVASELDNAHDKRPVRLVSPLIWHVVESPKTQRMLYISQLLPWYMPMRYNATTWQQGRAQVLSSHIELWTTTNVTKRVRYGDVCRGRNSTTSLVWFLQDRK